MAFELDEVRIAVHGGNRGHTSSPYWLGGGVTWRIINASAIGTSHMAGGHACQDTCFVDSLKAPDGAEYLVCLVSDGAGSARYAEQGSDLACTTAMACIEATLARGVGVCDSDVGDWVAGVQAAVQKAADAVGATARDYACTLLGAVIGQGSALFFQVGDGAIVVSSPTVQGVVFWPDAGPYANMTHFVTDDDAVENLGIATALVDVEEVALFSDGLQRLALAFETKLPHQPFFEPMFSVLRRKQPSECEALSTQLGQFLNSPQVNERTDDDKTLILATRRAV
ncbi:PP2C family serine/threonine-protein phosphatase [Ralstonia solanacearum]|uniref:PP2C family serine/threonine-protein phosphatase n=1 Tax=Ralstonia solanacearum TaxID=305 RepID=UPI003CC569DA